MEKYTLNEVVFRAMDIYGISRSQDAAGGNMPPAPYLKKISTFVHKTKWNSNKTLWEEAEDKSYPGANKKSYHFFSKEQMEFIIYADEIRVYFLSHADDKKVRSLPIKTLFKLVEDEHKDWEEYSMNTFGSFHNYYGMEISEGDYNAIKSALMQEALFGLFYTFNERLFSDDLNNSYRYGGNNETIATMDSKLRSKNYRNYYTARTEVSEDLFIVLDTFSQKIAEHLEKNLADQTAIKVADKLADDQLFRQRIANKIAIEVKKILENRIKSDK